MSIPASDSPFWLALLRFRAFGAVRLTKLEQSFSSMQQAFEASCDNLKAVGIEPAIAQAFCDLRETLDPQQEWEEMRTHGITLVHRSDPLYPPLLKTIYDPPPLLFVRGTLPSPSRDTLAVVGSRHPSAYGKRAAQKLIAPLAASSLVIVSGLAYGVDALAHALTLEAGGTTVAILGSGVDDASLYPHDHLPLAQRIVEKGGAVVSELPLGTPPLKQHFPFRNRLIAGWARGTLVIEANKKSGSLITARAALDAGRDVYAVPGPIDSLLSEGPNNLLKMGAIPVTDPTDILPMMGEAPRVQTQTYTPATHEEAQLLALLSLDPTHVDILAEQTRFPISVISGTLTMLEMKGVIKHAGSQYYTRAMPLA